MSQEKTIKLRATIDYEVVVPIDWSDDAINSYFNDSHWCQSGALDDIKEFQKTIKTCLCGLVYIEYLETLKQTEAGGP